ncbi:putative sporulation protein YqfD [uncultured Eubacteriales bacterium]|uniref:Putative sporulation protein YqfD n=1 Tax=uncultured Eubacteriales bacterium TaxID=172733 RepID=A0A212J8I1_9FIRM|nr:putative sporulation protein YqfD [uncultured Eubacteriales bacterium]
MQKIINFLRGSVRFTVTGPFPERFLNLCAQNGLGFWAVEWLEGGAVKLTAAHKDWRRAKTLAEKAMCTLTREGTMGIPPFLGRFRRRYALLAGMILSLAAVCVLSQFILTVEVSGNSAVSTAEILTELRRLGLRPGTYGPGVDEAMVGQQLLLRVDGLSWCAVNLKGTVAEVLVREAIKAPELLDENILGDVVARVPGIVTQVEVHRGAAAVGEGATVLPGEILISGSVHLEGPLYSGIDLGWQTVRAQGKVYARTWRTLEAEIPLETETKDFTGRSRTLWSLQVLGLRVNFYRNAGISYGRYDKITNVWTARLPEGREMPLSLTRETAREYETVTVPIDADAAEELLKGRLDAALAALLGSGGEVTRTDYSVRQSGGKLIVTLTAECKEEIGKFVPFS